MNTTLHESPAGLIKFLMRGLRITQDIIIRLTPFMILDRFHPFLSKKERADLQLHKQKCRVDALMINVEEAMTGYFSILCSRPIGERLAYEEAFLKSLLELLRTEIRRQ